MENEDITLTFFDFECFKKFWCVTFIDYNTHKITTIEDSKEKLENFYNLHKSDVFCGYNSRTYDVVIMKAILQNKDPYIISNEIVNKHKKAFQVLDKTPDIEIIGFDLLLLNKGLKQLEGFMGSTIKESSIDFSTTRELTREEKNEIIKYNIHDVEQTIEVFKNKQEEFDSQYGLIKEFNLPLTYLNKTKPQLSAIVLGAKRVDGRNDEFDIKFVDTIRLSEKYQYVYDWFKDKSNMNYLKSLQTDIAGVPTIFAFGGIHGAVSNYKHDGIILCCDVASLYPSIMIEYDFLSRNVQNKEKYKEIRDKRLAYKKAKDKRQAPLKIVLNSTYGASKDVDNDLYDPLQANNVCINGQLLLLDLIEKLETIKGVSFIQYNTDGLFLALDSSDLIEPAKEIAKEWEKRTRLDLEWDVYNKIYQKDVNNYIIIDETGHYKSKGAYVKKLSDIDYDLPIVNKALINYFTEGISIEETIKENNNLKDYQKIVKISSLYLYGVHNGEKLKEKVFRIFASNSDSDGGIYKVKTLEKPDGDKIGNTPDHCFIENGYINDVKVDDRLDKNYYVDLANKRINDFLYSSSKQQCKNKSEIKYINMDNKEFIENINYEDFDSFVDLFLFLKSNNFNSRQIDILTKLNYFSCFENSKKILKIIDVINLLYNVSKKDFIQNIKKSKIEDNSLLFNIIKNHCEKENNLNFYGLDSLYIIKEYEKAINDLNIKDFTFKEKINFQFDYIGYIIPTHKESDRKTLMISKIRELKAKKNNRKFGYAIETLSLGSGKKGNLTIFCNTYNSCGSIQEGDIIKLNLFHSNNGYFIIDSYDIINNYEGKL